jgi:hypothetical protein
LTTLAVAIPIVAGLSAWSDQTDSIAADSIAVVDGAQITKAEYDANAAFMTVLATNQIVGGTLFRSSTPRLISFAPPYADCVKAVEKTVPKNQKATRKQLERYCADTAKQIKEQAVGQSLTARYLLNEAAATQIEVTDAQIAAALPAKLKQAIGGRKNLAKLEAVAGVGEAFLREQVRIELIGQRIQRRVVADIKPVTDADARKHYSRSKADYRDPRTKRPRPFAAVKKRIKRQLTEAREEQAVERWQTSTLRAWKAKTSCRSGYVVEFCGNAS